MKAHCEHISTSLSKSPFLDNDLTSGITGHFSRSHASRVVSTGFLTRLAKGGNGPVHEPGRSV